MNQLLQPYYDYLLYLDDGGTPVDLPPVHHQKHEGYIFASELGLCPLAAFHKRNHTSPVYPEKMKRQDFNLMHKLRQGTVDAEDFQRAYLWKYGALHPVFVNNLITLPETWASPEMHVIDNSRKLAGRADIIYNDGSQTRVLELKRTEPMWDGSMTPASWHLLQCVTYHLITGLPVSIILLARNFMNVFDLHIVDEGYFFTDDKGWKMGETLSLRDYLARLEVHRQYMTGETSADPIPDFLNTREGWECFHKDGKKMKVKGEVSPRCPWWCHDPVFTYRKIDQRYEITPEF